MKNLMDKIKDFFNPSNNSKYYLIFMDTKPEVYFVEFNTLTEVYNSIVENKLPAGAYKIIKGSFISG